MLDKGSAAVSGRHEAALGTVFDLQGHLKGCWFRTEFGAGEGLVSLAEVPGAWGHVWPREAHGAPRAPPGPLLVFVRGS